MSSRSADGYRADIQGLRAVAVLLVVLFHLWPHRLSGGFVGVDVFFVISGYLITRHLAQEVERTGRLKVWRFWARRARRLLPAALLVLLASLAMAWRWLPQTQWEATVRQVRASALYVQNWALARDAVDYSALNADATVAQHYWSLSVEEQFYFVWPLLIMVLLLAGVALARLAPSLGGSAPSRRLLMAGGLTTLGVASFGYSILSTSSDQAVAYFATPTRVWEFALGGVIGIYWTGRRLQGPAAVAAAWAGLGAIGWAALNLDESSAFPGWVAAIPVIGSAAVLAAAPGSGRWGPLGLLSTPPARFLGDISYSLYLWHWPLIVIAPAALAAPMDRVHKAGIFALAVLLAWASTRFVEDPLRRGRLLRPTGAALGTAVVGMALTVAAGGLLLGQLPEDRQVELPTATTTCVGPGALDPANKCPSVSGKRPYYPSTVAAMRQNTNEAYPGCAAGMPGHELISCELGAPKKAASATVALIGDSHAKQWFPALDLIGRQRGWHVRTFTKSSCPATYALREVPGETARSNPLDCAAWVRRVVTALTADREVSAVFTAAYSTAYRFHSPADATYADPSVDGFQAVWRELRAAGLPVYVMEEVPRTNGDYVPSCLEELQQPIRCSVPVEEAMPTGRAISSAAAGMGDPGVHLISLRNQFCDDTRCYPVIGGLVVYRDYSHLTRQYAEALVPFISRQLGQEAP